jgi:hypothetical protein
MQILQEKNLFYIYNRKVRKQIYLGIRSDDIECVYQSSKKTIFTNEDCSIYIDTRKEALILFLNTETLNSQTIYFVS